ncbi:hypothetical protein GCM10010987_67760 [Bradyrhizobium guangdongense]|uniref:Uncharacterized protein n=2 Tax=Bradyrhizobium guangdongense TaxID=1325090 RepID=A0AA87WEM2_9BRAD|nr:hypothetical protein GCM10010987_67760 [Bradyrhizobium guangdongense]
MWRLRRLPSGVDGIGRLGGRGHDFGKVLAMRFNGRSLLRLGNGLGRNYGLRADRRDGRGRLVGVMIIAMMIVFVIIAMVVMIMIVRVLVMGARMIIVLMIVMAVIVVVVMIVVFVLAVVFGVGVQVLALMRRGVGELRLNVALDRLGRGIGAGLETFDDVAADALAMATPAGVAVARATTAVGAVLALFLGFAMGLLLGLDQRLPVGDRDLVVVGMDFAEGEEAVAVAAIFDEGGLERGFDPGDLGEVDIPAQLLALRGLEVKLFDAIAADHDDPGLFRVGGIDQHLVGHVLTLGGGGRGSPWARRALPGDATVHLIRG